MPEYLAPGVYVEETSFRSKSIEGVSTTTTGFVGPSRFGPIDLEPEILTSLADFERMFGDRQNLQYTGPPGLPNYLWHGVRSFFLKRAASALRRASFGQKVASGELLPYERPSERSRRQSTTSDKDKR